MQQHDHQHDESKEEEEEEEEPQHNEAQHSDSQQESLHHSQATPPTNIPQERETLPEECTICLHVYNEQEQRPRALPCGHTLCSLCIATLLKEGHLSCPTCLADHLATNASHFPVNYDLENMIRRFRTLQTKGAPQATAEKTKHNRAAGLGRKMQSIIKEQRESMEVLCGILQQELNQLEQYRVRLSLSLAKHGSLLEELDKVAQQHRKAMKLLMEEDLRVEAFMEEGERNQRNLKAAQNQLVCVASAQEAYPIVDAADDSAVVVEDWLQHNKAEFPSGTAYSTSCRVLGNTEAGLQVLLESEDTTESITSGHPSCTILEMLQKIHERSVELVKLHVESKFRKALEGGSVSLVKKDENFFSFSKVTSEGDKVPFPGTFTFTFASSDSGAESPSPKFEAPTSPSSIFQGSRSRSQIVKAHRRSINK